MSKQLPYLKHWFWLIQQYTIAFTFTFSLFSVFWTVNFAMKWLPYDQLADQFFLYILRLFPIVIPTGAGVKNLEQYTFCMFQLNLPVLFCVPA